MIITLSDGDIVSENLIIQERDGHTSYITLPVKCRRIVLYRYGNGRGQLWLGGFKAMTVAVNGKYTVLESLLEAVR